MRSYTLTLTTHGVVYKVDTLIKAINANERGMFAQITITADTANANSILVGGANLSSTVYGKELTAGEEYNLAPGGNYNDTSTLGIYALGVTTDGMKLHVILDER